VSPRFAPILRALGLTAVTIAAGAAPPAAPVPQSTLHACASIAADADRLACYDRLAGRGALGGTTPAPPATSGAAAASLARAPSSAAAPVPPPKESFGLYQAEHPKPPPAAAAIEARVAALGASASGRTTASLEGGAVWELDEADPLLAVGETVTITRAALGSYIMHTSSHRTHRVRRLH
jgi:hypothetical protein